MAKAELSVLMNDISGKAGTVVFVKGRDGTYVRPRIKPANPNTPAQEAVRNNLRRAAIAYRTMTPTQVAAWKNYALSQHVDNPQVGHNPNKTAINAFVELAAKFLQVNPTGTIPLTPPTSSFAGDNLAITASAGVGKVTFATLTPNSANTKTELMLQKLTSPNRTPQPHKYVSKGFVAFASGSLSADVNVPAGYYAAAYRYVNTVTGQMTDITPLNVNTVTMSVSSGASGSESKKKAA